MEAFVLQQELTPYEKPLYKIDTGYEKGIVTYPKTVLIPDTRALVNAGRDQILSRSRNYAVATTGEVLYWGMLTKQGIIRTPYIHYMLPKGETGESNIEPSSQVYGLEVPTQIAAYYGLCEGDQVGLAVSLDGLVVITSVNGVQDPAIFRRWPKDLSAFQSDYPMYPLPIEKYGDFDLRVITLLAPIGLGSSYWIIAPGGAGKTWILVKMFDACLKLSREIDKLYVIMCYVGDRPEDASQYLDILDKNPNTAGEFHQAPWDTHPNAQVDVATFVMNRARRLTATGETRGRALR
ncbi:MAG: hypothetical protein KatS3mg101_0789 [Patescibacteria group bacterium]|nr:MAG: hypothetical protein KatS3mg101_0789 [Patescibacteria group bacterium]